MLQKPRQILNKTKDAREAQHVIFVTRCFVELEHFHPHALERLPILVLVSTVGQDKSLTICTRARSGDSRVLSDLLRVCRVMGGERGSGDGAKHPSN